MYVQVFRHDSIMDANFASSITLVCAPQQNTAALRQTRASPLPRSPCTIASGTKSSFFLSAVAGVAGAKQHIHVIISSLVLQGRQPPFPPSRARVFLFVFFSSANQTSLASSASRTSWPRCTVSSRVSGGRGDERLRIEPAGVP